ncbi:MAG: Tat pathway signal protein [Arcobacter sp.]|nr:MAG: Tat pathway signal protein [Arcobacter sp.]
MENKRREFVKKALATSALVVTTGAIASNSKITESSSSGVVVGKSTKKEILYKETQNWDAFYKASY